MAKNKNKEKGRRAEIFRGAKGDKGKFKFRLIGDNGEKVATSGRQAYERKGAALKTLAKYFPDFPITDLTYMD